MSNQRRTSRPSSAASYSSRTSGSSEHDLRLVCRAAFLGRYDDMRDEIESKDDLMLLLQQTGRNPSNKVISKYWSNNTESLTFEDFVDVCKREPVTSEDDLMKAFRKIDLNGDGYISLDELFKLMTTKGEKMSRSQVKAMIDEVDENKDGKLDYKEFSRMIVSTADEFRKMSVKVMEKKEKRKLKKKDGDTTPRREKDELSLGSQLSLRSSASDNKHLSPKGSPSQSPEPSAERRASRLSLQSRASNANNAERRASKYSLAAEAADEFEKESAQERRGSRLSVRSNVTNANERRASKQSTGHSLLDGMQLSGSRQSLLSNATNYDEMSRPSPRDRRESRPKSASKMGRSQEPRNLKEWTGLSSKGTFFLDEDGSIVSHFYSLNLTEDSDVWITIQPLKIGESGESLDGTVTDTALLVLNEDDNSFVAFTESKDSRGKYSLRCNLSMGNYILLPFTTGCRLKPRRDTSSKEAKLITKDKEDKITLTRAFRKSLEEIFEMADLDGNGLLSRDEFNWYNLRTSGDEVADDEWQVVEDNIELERGEITRSGFIKLNEMEADDNDGDCGDLWITLSTMGFNKSLILDEACPFMLKVYTQNCPDPDIKVMGLENHKEKIDNAICDFVISKGEPTKVKGMKDLTLYQYTNDHRAIIVVENKSKTRVKMELDCRKRRGLVSHTGSLVATVTVPPQSSVVGHHILPLDDGGDFSVVCEESILK